MLHSELVLSKKPLSYFPLDGDLLDYAGLAGAPSASVVGGLYDGSTQASGVFFKGIPIVKGLRSGCHVRDSGDYISINSQGMFGRLGRTRTMSLEFYHMTNYYEGYTSGMILRHASADEFSVGFADGAYFLTVKGNSDERVTVSADSGQINRPKQIVLNWSPDAVSLVVDGKQSDRIDISGMKWTSDTDSLRFYGVSFMRVNTFNAVTIYPYQLTGEEIDELRNAAWQSDEVYETIRHYNGDFYSCYGGNVVKNGTYTINTSDDFRKYTFSEVGSVTNDGIEYPQFVLPEYVKQLSPVYSDGVVSIQTSSGRYIDYSVTGDIVGVSGFGARFKTKGAGQYSTKQYLMTGETGTKFIGIYAQSNNVYYEYIDPANEINDTALVASGVDLYTTPGSMFVGIDRTGGNIMCGPVTTDTYSTFYGSLTKLPVEGLDTFFSGAQFRFGADCRDEANFPYTGNLISISFGFTDTTSKLVFRYGMPTVDDNPLGFYVDMVSKFEYEIPAEYISDYDGSVTNPGSLSLYGEGDVGKLASLELEYKATAGGWVSTSGKTHGPANLRSLMLPDGIDVSGYQYKVSVRNASPRSPHITPAVNKISLVSYKSSNGNVTLVDGRAEAPLLINKYLAIPQDNVQAHARGLYDGIRVTKDGATGTSAATIIDTANNLEQRGVCGVSFALWVDRSGSSGQTFSYSDYPPVRLLKITVAGGSTYEVSLAGDSTTAYYQALNIYGVPSTCRLYVNGTYVTYSGSEPGAVGLRGLVKTNAWNHIFIARIDTVSTATAHQVEFGPDTSSITTSGLYDSICINDIAVFTDKDAFPTTTGGRHDMASRLASAYLGYGVSTEGATTSRVSYSDSTLSIANADMFHVPGDRQWKPLT